jgi:hypothetical protein
MDSMDNEIRIDSIMNRWAYMDSWGLQKWLNNEYMDLHAWIHGDYKSDSTMNKWAYIDSWDCKSHSIMSK